MSPVYFLSSGEVCCLFACRVPEVKLNRGRDVLQWHWSRACRLSYGIACYNFPCEREHRSSDKWSYFRKNRWLLSSSRTLLPICLGCMAACVCLPVLRENTLHFLSISLLFQCIVLSLFWPGIILYRYSVDLCCAQPQFTHYSQKHSSHTRDSHANREVAPLTIEIFYLPDRSHSVSWRKLLCCSYRITDAMRVSMPSPYSPRFFRSFIWYAFSRGLVATLADRSRLVCRLFRVTV